MSDPIIALDADISIIQAINSSNLNGYSSNNHFDTIDIIVVVVYFILVLATGFYSMCRSNRSTVSGYFLAGRYMFWLPVGASLFASNIGSEHFIGLAGSGAATGISVGAFELNALAIIQLTGWVFLPVFIASKVCTLPEYMSKRFGGQRIRTYLALLSIILYIFTKISVNLFSGAIFIKEALKWDLYTSVCVLLTLTAVFTVTGGLAAVMYTDTLQCFVMISGAAIVAIKAFTMVGGYSSLLEKFPSSVPSTTINGSTCGLPDPKKSLTMLHSWDDKDMPWPGFIFGQTPASIWYWCADQMMVQRLLAAKSLSHAQGGTLFAGFMKIFPLFLIVMPGMISRVLYPDEVGCVVPEKCLEYCGNRSGCSNIAYPKLVLELMPLGFRGLMVAVMLAALMSDLTSVYNSASTLFTMDIWPQIRKKASVWELMVVGRSFVLVMVIISIAWIPVIQSQQGGQLFIYIQSVSAYLAPPIASVYLLAILWKRMTEQGAFWASLLGFLVGMTRMVLDFIYPDPACGEVDTRPLMLRKVHYMYFACLLFWITTLSAIIISLMTEKTESFRLIKTTFWTRFDEMGDENCRGFNLELCSSGKIQENKDLPPDVEFRSMKDEKKSVQENPPVAMMILSWIKNGCTWFCGLNEGNEASESNHYDSLSTLHQTKKEKCILRSLLLIALAVPVVSFIYFSIDPDLRQ